MQKLISHQDVTVLGFYRSLLDAEGIASFIQNEHGQTLGHNFAGMFQRLDFLGPVLCIVNDDELERACDILQKHRQPGTAGDSDWQCPACKETIPGSFELCWNCGAERTAT